MHTLALLDIKVKEPTEESLARGKPVYMEPRFMSVSVAAQQLLEAEEAKKGGVLTEDANCIALARVGAKAPPSFPRVAPSVEWRCSLFR